MTNTLWQKQKWLPSDQLLPAPVKKGIFTHPFLEAGTPPPILNIRVSYSGLCIFISFFLLTMSIFHLNGNVSVL